MDEKTLIELLIDNLKEKGIDAYPPGKHKGECKKEYVVVKQDGGSQVGNYSSEYQYYDFLCYVPSEKYTSLSRLKNRVKEILSEDFFPRLMPTGNETSDYLDETVNGYMVSILYRNVIRNRNL